MNKDSTEQSAGIDVSKKVLDAAVWPNGERTSVANTVRGRRELIRWLVRHGIRRIGLEASGGYERRATLQLREAGFTVAVLQPAQVRHFAKALLQRAKTDPIDAALIARFTATFDVVRVAGHPIDEQLVEWLTIHDQLGEDIARFKTRRERYAGAEPLALIDREIARLKAKRRACMTRLSRLVAADPVLAARVALLRSIPSIGEQSSITLAVRMPELGSLEGKQAASLLGVAPFDNSSGARDGVRHIAGGRARPRRALHMCVLAAIQRDTAIGTFFRALVARGKPAKVAIVACARKLIVQANAVLKRQTPWQPAPIHA